MKKVLLGMSGGVDSSVSALLLKEKGFDVTGVTLSLCPNGSCCNINTYQDAKNICKSIGIDHFILEATKEFQKYVIDDFIDEYKECKTPNPCIECNRFLKFGLMYEKAKELGIDYIATGHYAKIEYSEKYKKNVLKKSNNLAKDQSYVLYCIPRELLDKVVFPLGEFESKEEVRKIAEENNFVVAKKPDSQDICFIPDGDYKRYLENNSDIKPHEGNIVDLSGKILGKHQGLYRYTIGQRKGMGISNEVPLFVIGFNPKRNELIVGKEEDLYKKEIMVKDINLLLFDKIEGQLKVNVKTRYSSREASATIEQENDKIRVVFDEPQARITPGQSAVFYIDDIVVGGGKIC